MRIKSYSYIILLVTSFLLSCGDSSNQKEESSYEKSSKVKREAYDKGYRDGKSHRYYDCKSRYDGTEFETVYLLSYKEGYNQGQYE